MDIKKAKNKEDLLFYEKDPYLKEFIPEIKRCLGLLDATLARITKESGTLADFSLGHLHFGLHHEKEGWVFREWAPNAERIFLIGDMTDWKEDRRFALAPRQNGQWELRLPHSAMAHRDLYRMRIYWPGGFGDRIPAWARRVVQEPGSQSFNAQVWDPDTPYEFTLPRFSPDPGPLFIYETHVGMASEKEEVGTYAQFAETVLPRAKKMGYNAIQLMAVQEHPYYASFGYQVSSYFAPSHRYGTPEELKALVDAAHAMDLLVVMDIVHSHAVNNTVEGLAQYDGTAYQFFHEGGKGRHPAWDSMCFNYGKPEVLHFLLSNCRFWMEEYNFDGFRFDGVTSMLYTHHGLGRAFTTYADYFGPEVDEEALVYLGLANRLIHEIKPSAVTIAEDVSGIPGLAAPQKAGGWGFDFRFAMGVPDQWIKLVKEVPDEHWNMGGLWHELTNRRAEEKTISYAESHDQALVGDQTLIFRLIGADMYQYMGSSEPGPKVHRGMALHKMIRLITLACAGDGYLTFMGNEFGHPEWIDFPRRGNDWSYRYARRQWRLADDANAKYRFLDAFEKDMIHLARRAGLYESGPPRMRHEHNTDQVLAFERAGLLWVFNFNPVRSFTDYGILVSGGEYAVRLNTDSPPYGGKGLVDEGQKYEALAKDKNRPEDFRLYLYLPSRTALVLGKQRDPAAGGKPDGAGPESRRDGHGKK